MNVGSITSMKSMAEEATETLSTTKAEAAKGDQQAIRKLNREQALENTQASQQSAGTAPGSRVLLNVKA
jgi:hypothetical protein